MYQATKQHNMVLNTVTDRIVKQGTTEWSLYLRWLGKGNKPLPVDGKLVFIEKDVEVTQESKSFSISTSHWEELDKCKTIASVKSWLKQNLK